VVPTCVGGEDVSGNKVWLTAEEHYVAHQLLVKMHPNHFGLAHAAIMMTRDKYGNRVNNKLFGWLKRHSARLRSEFQKGKRLSDHAYAELSAKLKGVPLKKDQVDRIRAAKLGVNNPMFGTKKTDAEKKHLSDVISKAKSTPEQKKIHSEMATTMWQNEEYRSLMNKAHVGRKNTENTKRMMSESNKKVWANRTEEERKQFSDKLKAGWAKRKADKGITK
jgi:hypothetical protein